MSVRDGACIVINEINLAPFRMTCIDGDLMIEFYNATQVLPDLQNCAIYPPVLVQNLSNPLTATNGTDCAPIPATVNFDISYLHLGCNLPGPPLPLDQVPDFFPESEQQGAAISSQIWVVDQECQGAPVAYSYHRNTACVIEIDFTPVRYQCEDRSEVTLEGFNDLRCSDPTEVAVIPPVCPLFTPDARFHRIWNCFPPESPSDLFSLGEISAIAVTGTCCLLCLLVTVPSLVWASSRKRSITLADINLGQVPLLTNIKIGPLLGAGEFGEVYKGTLNNTTEVALKSVKGTNIDDFANELQIINELRHPNVLLFYGIYETESKIFMVTEYMSQGDLLSVLHKYGLITVTQLSKVAISIASGMEYLHGHNIIHRDLAARNILISGSIEDTNTDLIAKIADFGLSRQIEDFYLSSAKKVPIRWTAPEAIQTFKFDNSTDVWSYGVVLWEIFSRGTVPYAGFSNEQVLKQVTDGFRMNAPEFMPPLLEDIMYWCWNFKKEDRPTFKDIVAQLSSSQKLSLSITSDTKIGPQRRTKTVVRELVQSDSALTLQRATFIRNQGVVYTTQTKSDDCSGESVFSNETEYLRLQVEELQRANREANQEVQRLTLLLQQLSQGPEETPWQRKETYEAALSKSSFSKNNNSNSSKNNSKSNCSKNSSKSSSSISITATSQSNDPDL